MEIFLVSLVIALAFLIRAHIKGNISSKSDAEQFTTTVNSPHPEKCSDYEFYEFVENTYDFVLKTWMPTALEKGFKLKPEYVDAIEQKIKDGEFINPLSKEIETPPFGIEVEKNTNNYDVNIDNENIRYTQKYAISEDELYKLRIDNKVFVFTGEINYDRDEATIFIIDNGGKIRKAVSSRTDYLVLGHGYGWRKVQEVERFNTEKNCNIRILNSNNFEFLLNNYN